MYYFKPGEATSDNLINICRQLFADYGVPEEVSTDGGPQFIAHRFKNFLQQWGVQHRISSVGYAQSNGRAEVGVKSCKHFIRDNAARDGTLNTNSVATAILQYRNTPLPDCNLSPAQILLHRQLRDKIPSHPSHYKPHADWLIAAEQRAESHQKRNQVIVDKHNLKARELLPLPVGSEVIIQGKDKKWNRQGRIVETLPFRQYRIHLAGSGRVTLQNRRFLKRCHTSSPPGCIAPQPSIQVTPSSSLAPLEPAVCPAGRLQDEQHHLPESDINMMGDPGYRREHEHEATGTVYPDSPGMCERSVLPAQVTESPQEQRRRRIPRALMNLAGYNEPGLKEG